MTFAESVALLLLTAVLTGLLVPIVKGYVDDRKLERQKRFDDERLRAQTVFEANLARQAKVIDAQAQLLDDLAEALWSYDKMLLRITYYALVGDVKRHQAAIVEYDERSWDSLSALLALISKCRRLTSPEIHDRLVRLYSDLTVGVDSKINELKQADPDGNRLDTDAWRELQHHVIFEMRAEIDGVLAAIATQLRLSEEASGADGLG